MRGSWVDHFVAHLLCCVAGTRENGTGTRTLRQRALVEHVCRRPASSLLLTAAISLRAAASGRPNRPRPPPPLAAAPSTRLLAPAVQLATSWCRRLAALTMALVVAAAACIAFPPVELVAHEPAGPGVNGMEVGRQLLATVPPIPVLQDLPAIASFLATSFDDATEDAVKALCLCSVFVTGRALQARLGPWRWPASAAGVASAAAAYPGCDAVGDEAGDWSAGVGNIIRARFGLPPKVLPAAAAEAAAGVGQELGQPVIVRVVDDMVEVAVGETVILLHPSLP